jgi:hypothetical protein
MNTEKVISDLKKLANFFEVYQTTTFEGFRTDKSGNTQKVYISILDAGPNENPLLRYHCVARSEDGKMATGNPDSSIDMVLLNVHWNNLDK